MSSETSQLDDAVSQRIDPTLSLGDFLATMAYFSGKNKTDMATFLGTSQAVMSRWMSGINTPRLDSSEPLRNLVKTFELSNQETDSLLGNNRARKISTHTLIPHEQTTGFDELPNIDVSGSVSATRILAGFAIRAETGPPITDVEANLIRFLIQATANS